MALDRRKEPQKKLKIELGNKEGHFRLFRFYNEPRQMGVSKKVVELFPTTYYFNEMSVDSNVYHQQQANYIYIYRGKMYITSLK